MPVEMAVKNEWSDSGGDWTDIFIDFYASLVPRVTIDGGGGGEQVSAVLGVIRVWIWYWWFNIFFSLAPMSLFL